MSDRDLVAALRAGDRLAAGQVYDVYGTRLYAYCHELLADAKLAADALRDTFIVAANRVRELNEPDEFGAWLYALARAECVRVGISDDAPADAAGAARGDRLARIALDCYSMLEPEQRELLDLAFRHRLVDSDLALVLGVEESAIAALVADAQGELETALLAVLAARTGDPRCEDSAGFGRRFDEIDGDGVSAWLQAAAKHVERCPICGDAVRNRRPLRLFEELPHSFMPPGVRSRVLEALRDPGGTAFAEQIAERAGRFDENGFPIGRGGGPSRLRKWILPSAGLSAVVAAVVLFMVVTSRSPSNAAASVTSPNAAGVSSTSAIAPASSASGFAELTGSASAGPTGSASTAVTPSARQSTSQQAVSQPTTPSAQHSCRPVSTSVPVTISASVTVTITYTVTPTPTSSDTPSPYLTTSASEEPTMIISQSPVTVTSCN